MTHTNGAGSVCYRLGLYEKAMPHTLSLPEKLKEAKAAGFDFLEMSVDESDEKLSRLSWTNHERLALLRASRETGLRVETMCLSGHRRFPLGSENTAIRERGLRILQEAVGLAADLGIRVIQLAGYDEYYGESNRQTRLLFTEGLRASVAYAAAYGVLLAFETMETPFMDTVEKAMHYVDVIGSPWLAVYPDLGNLTNAARGCHQTVSEDLRTGAGHIAAMHLKETRPGVYREVPFGTGHVDFTQGAADALQMGVKLFVGECWHTGDAPWRERIKEAHTFLREKIEAAL